jgi:membrane protein YqaA with SNARE-associated domain
MTSPVSPCDDTSRDNDRAIRIRYRNLDGDGVGDARRDADSETASPMLKRLYDRMIEIAAGPHAIWALIAVAFAESSFFPLPPDILLIPMMLARPSAAWRLAAYCTLASVAGGMLGYAIGYYGFDLIGRPILEFYHAMGSYDALKAGFDRWGVWIIIIKGMTPIPYKLVTIASGVAHFDFMLFVGASIVSRSLRFFLLAALLWWFGPAVRDFIEKRLMLMTSLFAVALVGGFAIIRYL